jgi:hypothetical protein
MAECDPSVAGFGVSPRRSYRQTTETRSARICASLLPKSERVLHREYRSCRAAESRNRSFAAALYNYM